MSLFPSLKELSFNAITHDTPESHQYRDEADLIISQKRVRNSTLNCDVLFLFVQKRMTDLDQVLNFYVREEMIKECYTLLHIWKLYYRQHPTGIREIDFILVSRFLTETDITPFFLLHTDRQFYAKLLSTNQPFDVERVQNFLSECARTDLIVMIKVHL